MCKHYLEIKTINHKNTFYSKNVFLLFLLLFIIGFPSSWLNQLSKQRSSWNSFSHQQINFFKNLIFKLIFLWKYVTFSSVYLMTMNRVPDQKTLYSWKTSLWPIVCGFQRIWYVFWYSNHHIYIPLFHISTQTPLLEAKLVHLIVLGGFSW